MPQSYSYDSLKESNRGDRWGHEKKQASQIFKISRNTLNLWLNRREETGDYRAKVGYQPGYNPKIINLEKFQEFV